MTLDQWYRLACFVDVLALNDPRWLEVEFRGIEGFLPATLAQDVGVATGSYNAGRWCFASELLHCLE